MLSLIYLGIFIIFWHGNWFYAWETQPITNKEYKPYLPSAYHP